MDNNIFLLGDADDVRKKIQGFLLSGDLDALKRLSSSLSNCIVELGSLIKENFGASIIFCGGDELLACVDRDRFDKGTLHELTSQFRDKTGVTISFGVGRNTAEAFINLARAKSSGPGSIFAARVE